jgi:hypothetical protein
VEICERLDLARSHVTPLSITVAMCCGSVVAASADCLPGRVVEGVMHIGIWGVVGWGV